jgi:hypothetical protein
MVIIVLSFKRCSGVIMIGDFKTYTAIPAQDISLSHHIGPSIH